MSNAKKTTRKLPKTNLQTLCDTLEKRIGPNAKGMAKVDEDFAILWLNSDFDPSFAEEFQRWKVALERLYKSKGMRFRPSLIIASVIMMKSPKFEGELKMHLLTERYLLQEEAA